MVDRRPVRAVLLAIVTGLTVAACAMVGSSPLERTGGFQCDSSAGAYFLPKTVLLAEVEQTHSDVTAFKEGDKTTTAKRKDYALKLNFRRVPDNRFGFCLDYLARATSDDIVNIRKYTDTHLLGLVSTDAVDESKYIFQTLIRSAFILASGDPTFGQGFGRSFREGTGTAKTIVFKGEFDPFDPRRTAEVNQALKDYGFCIDIPGISLNRTQHGQGSYCEHPRIVLDRFGAPDLAYRYKNSEGLVEKGQRRGEGGIFYRPRLPVPIHVYVKDNLKVPHWRLGITRVIEMENISPVVAVGVERTMFAQRRTSLIFSEGHLDNVCIFKGSELLAAAFIPLQIAQSVVQLPASILQVRIDQTKGQSELAKVENELIKTQIQHLKFLDDIAKDPTKTGTLPTYTSTNPNTVVSANSANKAAEDAALYTKAAVAGRNTAQYYEELCGARGKPDATLPPAGLQFQNVITPASSQLGATP